MALFKKTESVASEYKRLRKESRAVVEKISTFCASYGVINQAANALKMLEGKKTIVMGEESDMSYLMDYALFEAKIKTQTSLAYFYDYGSELSAKEEVYLDAMLENYTSLFQIVGFDKASASILLTDILNDNHPLTIQDIALSQNDQLMGVILFTRIFTFGGICMTSGASMTFFPNDKTEILNRLSLLKFKHQGKLSSAQLFQFSFRLHQSIGIETRFEE